MKKLIPLFILIIISFQYCQKKESGCGVELNTQNINQNLRILFIGNSHTLVNDIPKLVRYIGKSLGDTIYTEMSAPGGYNFERHCQLDATISAIKYKYWDFIVLQESVWRTALPDFMAETAIYPYADSLISLVRTYNQSAEIILYMTHGYAEGADWCDEDPSVCTYRGMQDNIKRTYLDLSDMFNVQVAPCGTIWKILMDKNNDIVLHSEDKVHANIIGSYVSACTIYCTICRKKLNNAYHPGSIDQEQTILIQNTVSDVLFNCIPNWENY